MSKSVSFMLAVIAVLLICYVSAGVGAPGVIEEGDQVVSSHVADLDGNRHMEIVTVYRSGDVVIYSRTKDGGWGPKLIVDGKLAIGTLGE